MIAIALIVLVVIVALTVHDCSRVHCLRCFRGFAVFTRGRCWTCVRADRRRR